MSDDVTWKQPQSPPPPLFLGKKERDLTKQVNDEVIERVIGQNLIYFPLSIEKSQYHPLYGEAIEKVYNSPMLLRALVTWGGEDTVTENYGLDKESKITIKFHKRRITEDQDLYVREGDIVFYGSRFYEIVKLSQPRLLFGQVENKFEIVAECIKARQGIFNEPQEITELREKIRCDGIVDPNAQRELVQQACCADGKIKFISASEYSPDYPQYLDYVGNPGKYKGCIIYLTEIGSHIDAPFYRADRFYLNQGGEWSESFNYVFEEQDILTPPGDGNNYEEP